MELKEDDYVVVMTDVYDRPNLKFSFELSKVIATDGGITLIHHVCDSNTHLAISDNHLRKINLYFQPAGTLEFLEELSIDNSGVSFEFSEFTPTIGLLRISSANGARTFSCSDFKALTELDGPNPGIDFPKELKVVPKELKVDETSVQPNDPSKKKYRTNRLV